MNLRIGEGWNTHQLAAGHPVVLVGVVIPHTQGLLGHFPDTNARFKGADPHTLLAEAARRLRGAGDEMVNVDTTDAAQAPKMAPVGGAAPSRRVRRACRYGGRRTGLSQAGAGPPQAGSAAPWAAGLRQPGAGIHR